MKHLKSSLLVLFILGFILSSCHFPGNPWVKVEITNLEEGQSIVQYEELNIVTKARASQGVDRVELYINGESEQQVKPSMGHPHEFLAEQAWTPLTKGQVIISVVAVDRNGTISEPTSIILNVVASLEQGITSTPTPEFSIEEIAQTQTAQAGCSNSASFVEHVTIPLGTNLPSGSNFTKIWRVNNNGTCEWAGYQLIRISGESMSASSPRALPVVKAGANADIVVDMVAPSSAGAFSAVWRIQSSDGSVFGPELPISINVSELPTKTFTPTATKTNTASPLPSTTITPTSTHTPFIVLPPIVTIIPPPILPINVQQFSKELTIAGTKTGSLTVSCPSGSVAVSGGFSHPLDLRVWESIKDGNGWKVSATNKSSVNKILNVTVTCMFNSGGTTDEKVEQVKANAMGTTQLTATCPSGSSITGGGWVALNDNAFKVIQSSKSGNGWQIIVENNTTMEPWTSIYAVCLSGAPGTTTQESNLNNTIGASTSTYAQKLCPGDSIVTGGGFSITKELIVVNNSVSANGWITYVYNNSLEDKQFDTFTICYQP